MRTLADRTGGVRSLALRSARSSSRSTGTRSVLRPASKTSAMNLAGLPGAYTPPSGRLALAKIGDEPAGCIALRRVDADRAEAKRLYVRPAFRGHGSGPGAARVGNERSPAAGYREIVGDTMPAMHDALALYDRMGFERVGTAAQSNLRCLSRSPKSQSSFASNFSPRRDFRLEHARRDTLIV